MDTSLATSHTPRRLRLAVLIVVVALAALTIGVVAGRSSNHSTATINTPAELASVQKACQQWLGADRTQTGNDTWCTGMTGWMAQYSANNGMGPQMMWGDSTRLKATCAQWMTADPPQGASTDPHAWCDTMVSWMSGHMRGWSGSDSWNGWMTTGRMMGN